jgi:D-glycero-D-manno-heptose 1,7-bisphosphate phosphatase
VSNRFNKAVFIDKDGTLIRDVPYNVDPAKIVLEEGAIEALALLYQHDYMIIIVSNQSGIARGYFSSEDFELAKQALLQMLSEQGIYIDDFYYCPHHPEGNIREYSIECSCRKPQAGMLLQAADKHNIDMSRSWMIGDILNDVEAGHLGGCRSILIDNGNETEWILNETRTPDYKARNLFDAARHILDASAQLKRSDEKKMVRL